MLPFNYKKYKCHKEVQAMKINGISLQGELHFEDCPRFMQMTMAWLDKYNPEVGGYLVMYSDGYLSFSPAKAFENGYTEVEN